MSKELKTMLHYKEIMYFSKKQLLNVFKTEKLFRVISVQINFAGEYSVKLNTTLRKDEKELLKVLKEQTTILAERINTEQNDVIRCLLNIRFKKYNTIEELEAGALEEKQKES